MAPITPGTTTQVLPQAGPERPGPERPGPDRGRHGRRRGPLRTVGSGATAVAALVASVSLSTGGPAAAAAHPAGASGPKVTVRAEKLGKYGQVLVDQAGQALYYDTADHPPRTWACKGACLQAWPALVLPKGQTGPAHAPGLKGLSVLHGPSGAQVAWHGRPLYTFVGDKPGQVNGQGFKHVWWVAQLASPAKATTTGHVSSSGGGSSSGW